MFVLCRDGVEFWSTPRPDGLPPVEEGEHVPFEDGVLWNIPHAEFVAACDLGLKETEDEVFTLSNWERIKEGKMNEVRVGLIKGRHEMPVEEYIFDGPILDVHDYTHISDIIVEFLENRVGIGRKIGVGFDQDSYDEVPLLCGKADLVVYVTGLTPVTAELVFACIRNGVKLTLMNYDSGTGNYVPQPMF